MSCEHFTFIPEPTFLSALTGKVYWTCLYPGRMHENEEEPGTIRAYSALQQQWQGQVELTEDHKVMINCETFEIYCTECKKEITDTVQELSRSKKGKARLPLEMRHLLVPNLLTEDVLFSGNAEYPPSFQKQRRGLCGLKANSVSSYLNATVQLLTAVPIIGEMSAMTDPLKIESRFLRGLFGLIETIWSGKYRITSAEQVQRQLLQEDSNFSSYRFKTPQHLLYFIVKKLVEELHYPEVPCQPSETNLPPFNEWNHHQEQRHYSFPRELLAGECVLQCVCGACGGKQFATNRFECLRVSYQRQGQGGQLNLCQLIEESFDWRNNHAQAIKRIEEGRLQCENCKERVREYFAYVRLPNHLVLQLGDDLQGLDSSLPDQIDLLSFSQEHVKKKGGGQAIYQYVGSVYRKERRFCTHVRHAYNKKEYTICDQLITEGGRCFEQVKLAIYRRAPNPKNQPLQRNILSCLQVNVSPIVPLPDYWSLYLKYNHHVQPLVNPFICSHGKIKHNLTASKLRDGPQRLPIEIYQYLLETFGGRMITVKREGEQCQTCQKTHAKIAQIKNSEKEMASFADKLSNKKERVLINRTWLDSWKQFAYETPKRGYRAFGHIRPGSIKNATNNIEQEMKNGTLKKISPEVWYFLHKFYGGGPLISKTQIHPNVVLTAAVDLRYDNLESILFDLYGPPSLKQHEALKLRSSASSNHSQTKEEVGKEEKKADTLKKLERKSKDTVQQKEEFRIQQTT